MDGTEHLNPKAIYPPVYFQDVFSPHISPRPHSFLFFQISSFTTFIYINFRNPQEAAPNTL